MTQLSRRHSRSYFAPFLMLFGVTLFASFLAGAIYALRSNPEKIPQPSTRKAIAGLINPSSPTPIGDIDTTIASKEDEDQCEWLGVCGAQGA